MTLPLAALITLFLARLAGGTIVLLVPGSVGRGLSWTLGGVADIAAMAAGLMAVIGTARPALALFGGDVFGSAGITVDALSGFFLFAAGAAGLPLALFSAGFTTERRLSSADIASYHLLLGAAALVLCAHNVFVFLFAWELTSLAMYLVITDGPGGPHAAVPAFFTLSLAKLPAAALTAALLVLATGVHGFGFGLLASAGPGLPAPVRGAVLVLTLIGFGAKVGMVPMQVWMPRGYPAAPANAAAAMAGIVLNLGIYGLIRVDFTFLGRPAPWWGLVVMLAGALTAFTGILYGVVQNDVRRFISFSSVEHAGIMLIGIGVALLGKSNGLPLLTGAGLVAACIDLLQHSAAKTLLFAAGGSLEIVAGSTAMGRLGGLVRRAPLLAAVSLAGILSLAAMPPLGGFAGEWLTFEALMQGFRLQGVAQHLGTAVSGALLAITAGLALIAFVKLYGIVFLGVARSERADHAGDVSGFAAAGLVLLALAVVGVGLAVPWLSQFAAHAVAGAAGMDVAADMTVWPHVAIQPAFSNFSSASPTELAILIPLFLLVPLGIRAVLRRPGQREREAAVWASASDWPEPAIEWTPLGYSNFARVIFSGLYGLHRSLAGSGPTPYFPQRLMYRSRVVYAFERWLYSPLVRTSLRITAAVRATQSGIIGQYLLYMLFVLLVILAVARFLINA